MQDISHRAAVAALLLCAILVAGMSGDAGALATPWMQHRQFMLGLLGAGLALSAFVPGLRPAAIAAAVLSEASFLAIAWPAAGAQDLAVHGAVLLLLAFSGGVFLHEARQQARWEGVLPSTARGGRSEA
jgi:hypothetical protein